MVPQPIKTLLEGINNDYGKCPIRILFVIGHFPNGIAVDGIIRSATSCFDKRYPIHQVNQACTILAYRRLVVADSSDRFRTTSLGNKIVGAIERLAESEPNPWRQFTRKSYSPNI